MRRSISNLSRAKKVSRARIYRILNRLGIEKRGYGNEYTPEEWAQLTAEIDAGLINDAKVAADVGKVIAANGKATVQCNRGAVHAPRDSASTAQRINDSTAAPGAGGAEPDCGGIAAAAGNNGAGTALDGIDAATLRERLAHAKHDYDFIRALLAAFQSETDAFYKTHGRTSVTANNGALIPIPSVTSTEKYIKLNIALSKMISTLEQDLDLEVDGGEENVYG